MRGGTPFLFIRFRFRFDERVAHAMRVCARYGRLIGAFLIASHRMVWFGDPQDVELDIKIDKSYRVKRID